MPTPVCSYCGHAESTHVGNPGAVSIGGCGIILTLAAGYCIHCTIAPKPCFAFVA